MRAFFEKIINFSLKKRKILLSYSFVDLPRPMFFARTDLVFSAIVGLTQFCAFHLFDDTFCNAT